MRLNSFVTAGSYSLLMTVAVPSFTSAQQANRATPDTGYDPVQALVDRLDLARYKNTIKDWRSSAIAGRARAQS